MSPWGPDWQSGPRIRPKNGIRSRNQRGAFATTWWASRWILALERLVDPGRLMRGRTYARQGQVVELDLRPGLIEARVQGSRPHPYEVTIKVPALSDKVWDGVADVLAERAIYAAQLLAGEMPNDIEEIFAAAGTSLFPAGRRELVTDCTCPDWADPCKHTAAVCYLVGERFDEDPFLMLELRGRTRSEITDALRDRRSVSQDAGADDDMDLSGLGTELVGAKPRHFWRLPGSLDALGMSFDAPEVNALPVKRLGAPPFAEDPAELTELMEQAYRTISAEARRLALGDE